MIGTIDIKVNAARPNLPLSPFYAFVNSPSQVRVINVPRQIGNWKITKVFVTVNLPDNQSASVEATLTGGCWHATIPASTATGRSTNGFAITANGVKEDGETAVTGYVLGKGDVSILATDGTITVGETTYYLHILDAQPTTPKKGDVCIISGQWKVYNGSAWVPLGNGGGDVAHSDFASVDAIGVRYTIDDIKSKVNQMLSILKGTSATLAVVGLLSILLPLQSYSAVQTARLDALYNDSLVVTNVVENPACDTNAVQAIINANVSSNYLCSVAAASAMTNAVMSAAEESAAAKYLPMTTFPYSSGYKPEIKWDNNYNLICSAVFKSLERVQLVNWGLLYANNQTLPAYLASTAWHGTNKSLADYGITNATGITRAYADSRYAPTNVAATVEGWETYWTGDKVRLSVTNYYGNTSGELPRLRIEEFDHSTTNGSVVSNFFKVVWDEESRHTNYQASVDARVAQISNDVVLAAWMQTASQLAGKAPKAWQSVSSTGGAAPANTVWMTAPNTVFAGGTEYAHVAVGEGGIYVLTANGANVYTEGEEGQFRIKDDSGQNFFGFDVRQSYTLGCRTDAISVNQSQHLVTLTYDLTAAENPSIVTCTNLLTGTWSDCSVTWEQNPPPNTKVCYIDVGTAPHGYYKAEIRYAGGSKFVTNMQADLAGGIAASNTTLGVVQSVYPEITSTGIVWRVKQ